MAATPPTDTAVLLVNLGTPDAPTPAAVRRYLSEFLMDPRVVQLPRLIWWPLLHGLVLPLRSARVARKYAQIWMPGGSPLAVHTAALADAVQSRLPGLRVAHAMRYGTPAFADVLARLRDEGAKRVLVLPLYPQYSTTTTASVGDLVELARVSGARVEGNSIGMVADYHVHPRWLAAVAGAIRSHRERHGAGERLLFSFHGIPERLVAAGDPYAKQCGASAAAIAGMLDLPDGAWQLTYQSRFGRERWLQPYTSDVLRTLAGDGVKRVDVVCPGFAVDCLETLEEIAVENATVFRDAGGDALRYIPCLNDAPAHAHALAGIAADALELDA